MGATGGHDGPRRRHPMLSIHDDALQSISHIPLMWGLTHWIYHLSGIWHQFLLNLLCFHRAPANASGIVWQDGAREGSSPKTLCGLIVACTQTSNLKRKLNLMRFCEQLRSL